MPISKIIILKEIGDYYLHDHYLNSSSLVSKPRSRKRGGCNYHKIRVSKHCDWEPRKVNRREIKLKRGGENPFE